MGYLIPHEELEAICKRYRSTGSKDYRVAEDIDAAVQLKARKHLKVPATSRLVAVLDSTVYKTLEYGLALCDDGIFWTNPPSTRTRRSSFRWDDYVPLRIARSDLLSATLGMNVDFGEGSVYSNAASDFPTQVLIELLQVIQFGVCRFTPAAGLQAEEATGQRQAGGGWSLSLNGVVVGPFDVTVIHALISAADLDPEITLAWKEGMTQWERVAQIKRLLPRERAAPPPLPGTAVGSTGVKAESRRGAGRTKRLPSMATQVDVNIASRDELLTLPFMTAARAKAIEKQRVEQQGLSSVEEIGKLCSLKPHEVEALRHRTVFRLSAPTKAGTSIGKRVVDF